MVGQAVAGKVGQLVALGTVAVVGSVLALATLMTMSIFGDAENAGLSACGTGTIPVSSVQGSDLSKDQLSNAATIVSVGQSMGIPRRGQEIALAVAHQESRFLNYANGGQGELAPNQQGVDASLELPHQAVGNDHGSIGIFQQQWPGWGSMPELMDPATSARKFYEALLKVRGWEDMSLTAAGQAVQNSAFPDAYADDEPLAVWLLSQLTSSGAVSTAAGLDPGCATGTLFSGDVVFPLPASAPFTDQANWHDGGAHWTREHTGTDFSARCGTSVLAATSGTVVIKTDQSWSGRWLVQVSTGTGRLTTWYAHMQAVTVSHGDQVAAGQQIGEVGSEGNSTGCHLHFEVHPRGGSMYEDDIDPTQWLQQNIGQQGSPQGTQQDTPVVSTSTDAYATVLTANVPFTLSQGHASKQIRWLLDQRPDVLLLQEVHDRDVAAIARSAPGNWAVWQPSRGDKGASTIVWNADRFAARAQGVELGFDGDQYDRWMTWAVLQSDEYVLPVIAMHLPPNARTSPRMRAHFLTMMGNARELFERLTEQGYPPVAGADWNASLVRAEDPWAPVRVLRDMGLATNWQVGPPCKDTGPSGGRIDGFAFHPEYVGVADQGCLPKHLSDHRPVWMAIGPPSAGTSGGQS